MRAVSSPRPSSAEQHAAEDVLQQREQLALVKEQQRRHISRQ